MHLTHFVKRALLNIAPYILVDWYRSRKRKLELLSIKNSTENIEFNQVPNYKQIIAVSGFGYSGSGAVIDLLREYEGCVVLGGVDSEGTLSDKKIACGEMDFLRHSGGLFEIEKYIGDNNIFHNDLLLHRFLKLTSTTDICKNQKIRSLFHAFFRKISDFQMWDMKERAYNTCFLPRGKSEILYLKSMDKKEYVSLSKRFLTTLFVELNHQNKDNIVLDQFVSDVNFDYAHYTQYVDHIKLIVVYRDPRDVYTFAKIKDVSWIAHDTVEDFISWCSLLYSKFSKDSSDYLTLRFEDLVLNYDKTIPIIEKYLEFTPDSHVRKFKHLNPRVSAKNIAIWKKYDEYKEDCSIIKTQFPLYCYGE